MIGNIFTVALTLVLVGIIAIIGVTLLSSLPQINPVFMNDSLQSNISNVIIGGESTYQRISLLPLIGVVVFLGIVIGVLIPVFSGFGGSSSGYPDIDDDDDEEDDEEIEVEEIESIKYKKKVKPIDAKEFD